MIIKNLIDEDFVNYKKPSMFIATSNATESVESAFVKTLNSPPRQRLKQIIMKYGQGL